jgi:3-oxoacyl-[acyl-carrier-protein] synthase III
MGIYIKGLGNYLPNNIIKNSWFEERLDTTDEWIYNKVGIRERRQASLSETTSDLAVKASLEALNDANLTVEDIDLIVLASSSPDMIQPPTASIVQGKLKAINAAAYDVSAVCAGFVFALNTAYSMQKTFNYKNVLVIGAETYSRILDYNDRSTCVFFGDGAGAVVLSNDDSKEGILNGYLMTEGDKSQVIRFQGGGATHPTSLETLEKNMHRFEMEGKKVWDFAVRVLPLATKEVLKKSGLSIENLDKVIFHQANINIIKNGMQILDLDMHKTHTTIENYGNTSGASIPITLADAYKKGKLKKDDLICLVGFGGGLSYGATLLRWGK